MSELVGDFQNCCVGLLSTKVTVRAKNADKLSEHLGNRNLLVAVDSSNFFTWDSAVYYVNAFLLKEAEKLFEDEQKKSVSASTCFKRTVYGDLLLEVVKLANRDVIRLQVSKLIECVETCFQSRCMSKHFSKTYTFLLRDRILAEKLYWGQLSADNWLRLYAILKQLIRKPVNETDKIYYIESLHLLIKWGPLHSFPVAFLRDEFDFMEELCANLSSEEKAIHEKILQLLIEFYKHTAKDCRMACCKFGENTFGSVRALYSTNSLDRVKLLLFDYLLLQVKLHHPKGAVEGSSVALAISWHAWLKKLKTIYQILCSEVDKYLCTRTKNYSLIVLENEHKTVHRTFINLFVEIYRQMLTIKNNNDDQSSIFDESVSKKRKIEEECIDNIIERVRTKRDWPWINILTHILKRYPQLIRGGEFTKLLQLLSEIQVESKDADMRYHLYECLIVLADVQQHIIAIFMDVTTVESLWSVIWESTLRAVGLNQNESQTNHLLQKLITHNHTLRQQSEVFRAYFSGVLRISKHSLTTLQVACSYCPLPENTPQFPSHDVESSKLTLLKLLLSKENCVAVFGDEILAEVCVSLILKTFPKCNRHKKEENGGGGDYGDIEEVYKMTCVDGGLLVKKVQGRKENGGLNSHIVDKQMFDELVGLVVNIQEDAFAKENNESAVFKLITSVLLSFNVLSYLLHFEVVRMEELADLILYRNMLETLDLIVQPIEVLCARVSKRAGSNQINELKGHLQLLEKLFQINILPQFSYKFREVVPVGLLRPLFDLKIAEKEETDCTEVKILAVQVIGHYCCVRGMEKMCKYQRLALDALIPDEFNANLKSHYDLAVIYLSFLKDYECGTLTQKLIVRTLLMIENVMISHSTCFETLLMILRVLRDLYPHIVLIDSDDLRQKSVELLQPIYTIRSALSTKVTTALIDCMGILTKLDEDFSWAKWDNKHVSEGLLEFVSSNYQEVRLTAVQNLAHVFQKSSSVAGQQNIFEKLHKKCDDVFLIENVGGVELSEERKIDETVTRTASVMHTYGMIMAISGIWRRKALLALLQVSHKRKLNVDTLRKTLKEVARYLGFTTSFEFLKNYLGCLLEHWYKMTDSLDEFPFSIVDCSTEREFYLLGLNFIVPLLAQEEDLESLTSVASVLGVNTKELLERCFPEIMSKCFLSFTTLPNVSNLMNVKKIHRNLVERLGEEAIKRHLQDKIDEIIVNLIKFVYDPDYFKEVLFGVDAVLLQPESTHYSVEIMHSVFECLQEKFLEGQSLMSHCIEKHPQFIQKILLNLTVDVYTATVLEEKMINFCHYTIILNEILPFLKTHNPMRVFLVNYVTCSLVNLINNEKEGHTALATAACKHLKQIFQNILSDCAELIEKLLVRIVSTLVPIARNATTKIGAICLDLLNFLIIDNAYVLLKAVELLDPFPEEELFEKLSNVHHTIKYGNKTLTLEEEIRLFLNTGVESGCRAEGLKHLKKHLAERKDELKRLYVNLSEMRGFAEDAQDSLLHRLICALVKLTRSENAQARLEAARCLGEIGPADLTTLVLQTDLGTLDFKYTHFELVTGRILGVFVRYIVDADVEVVKATSAALYRVLQSREGRSIIASKQDYGSGAIDKNLLLPFITPVKSASLSQIHIEEQNFINRVNSASLWCPQTGYNHSEWIRNLVCAILETISDTCYLPSLIPVCKAKVQFAELLLPLLINLLLYTNNKTCIQIICRQVNYFFEKHWSLTTQHEDNSSLLIPLTQTSVQCMLDVVHFYRIQRSQIAAKKNATGLQVNYLHVARAAQFCFAHFSVLLYIELWAREQLERIRDVRGYQPFATDVTELDVIYQEQDEHTRNTLHSMLKNAYTAIGETDALHGCSLSQFFSNDYCKDLGSLELLQYYDMQISHGAATSSIPNLMDALKNYSLYELPLICKADITDSQYECMWRLAQWDEKVSNVEFEEMHNSSYEKLRYIALKALHDKDEAVYSKALLNARKCVIEDLKCSSLESCKNLYNPLCKLQSLQELEDFGSVGIDDVIHVINKWKSQDTINKNEFFYMEPIKAQRIAIIKNFLTCNNTEDVKACLIDSYLEVALIGRQEGSFNIARRALGDLHYIENITQESKLKVVFEEAQLNWASGNKHIGKLMLRQLLNTDIEDTRLKASVLKLYGTWMADASCQSSQVIIRDYLLESIKVSSDNNSDAHDAYIILAKFADREYQHVLAYTKSTGFQRTIQNVERSRQKADDIRKKRNLNEDERRAHITLERQSTLDESKINCTYKEKDTFLHLAVKYYLRNLEASDLNNMSVFRVISLYLENRTSNDLKSLMQQHLPRIPSYKYVTILPQLVPHITAKSDDAFGTLITAVVLRCAKEHPHHTLPLILALINGDKDRIYSNSTTQTDTNEMRLSGAKWLLKKLKEDGRMSELVDNMMRVADGLIELAYMDIESRGRKDYEIPRSSKLRQLKRVENVLVPTVTLAVSKTGNYNNIIGIREFTYKYSVADGVNAPKRISCQGTDGILRMQLVKGKDDLRQDAVMQQVFNIMNTFLTSNKQTKRLLIRTYKIVPLSMRSGILEWVENSMPIGEYLVGDGKTGGAHALYSQSSQYSAATCRRKLKDVAKSPNEQKLRTFLDICKNFPPVFHKFFETSFPQPTVWYERRRAYMHSVATSSMCCYILGIGDRHVSNILMDKQTAEVVHIDFGIAFDQGHILPTPETVPFRLTRDIVDGMGVSGIEGVFRRSCEKTMEVLRQNSQTIITILEVLLYDPLYSWAVTPAEAYNRQQEEVDGNVSTVQYTEEDAIPKNISAERALLRLKEKLQGTEDGTVTSVEGQVAKLIQQARNPENLCRLFNGWQAYL